MGVSKLSAKVLFF